MVELTYKVEGISNWHFANVYVIISCAKRYEDIDKEALYEIRRPLQTIRLPNEEKKDFYHRMDVPFELIELPRTAVTLVPAWSSMQGVQEKESDTPTKTYIERVESLLWEINKKYAQGFKLSRFVRLRKQATISCMKRIAEGDGDNGGGGEEYYWKLYYDYPFHLESGLMEVEIGRREDSDDATSFETAEEFAEHARQSMINSMLSIFTRVHGKKIKMLERCLGIEKDTKTNTYSVIPKEKYNFIDADRELRLSLAEIRDFKDFNGVKKGFVESPDDPIKFEKFRAAKLTLLGYESIRGQEFVDHRITANYFTETEHMRKYQDFIVAMVALINFIIVVNESASAFTGEEQLAAFNDAREQFITDPLSRHPDKFEQFRFQGFQCVPDKEELIRQNGEAYYEETFREREFMTVDCLSVRRYSQRWGGVCGEEGDEAYREQKLALKVRVLEAHAEYEQQARESFTEYMQGMECMFAENLASDDRRVQRLLREDARWEFVQDADELELESMYREKV